MSDVCSRCGQVLRPGARFCPICGQAVPSGPVCPGCQSAVRPGARFCARCGRPVATPSPLSGRRPLLIGVAILVVVLVVFSVALLYDSGTVQVEEATPNAAATLTVGAATPTLAAGMVEVAPVGDRRQ